MELRVWRKLLLQWVQKCNFIENILCLEESDIEAFFANMSVVKLAELQHSASLTNIAPGSGTLKNFLHENYPHFEPHFEDDGRVAHDDYIYVYSLLLHYTCILTPIPYFHNICNELPKTMQQCIVVFFEHIVNIPQLTRNCLSQTILLICKDAENQKSLVPTVDSSIGADATPIDNDAIGCSNLESPSQKKRNILSATQTITPPTPKSELLDQCTRELLGLRAKLQTVQYEKTYLEDQITEDKQKIQSLSEENKQLSKIKINPPKESDEDSYANNTVSNEVDKLKRQMQKKLDEKDDIIAERDEQMLELKSACDKVSAKLKTAEKELCIRYKLTNELEFHSQGITQMLAIKDEAIACLQRDKLELEQCLKETRDELHKGREVLNASSDLLDTSLSSGSMTTTPENLACSVIDKQLREKEQENEALREQLISIQADSTRFLKELLNIHQLDVPSAPYDNNTQVLNIIKCSIDKMQNGIEQDHQRLKELQDQFDKQKMQCSQYEECIQQLRNDADKLAKEFEECRSNLIESNEALELRESEITERDKRVSELGHQVFEFANTQRAQEQCIKHQDSKLAEQQIELTNAQKQLNCFFQRISAQIAQNGSILQSNGEISFEDVENMLLQTFNQLDDTKAELYAKCELLTAQNDTALKMLKTINGYIREPIEQIFTKSENKHLQILYTQVVQFVYKYERLQDSFNILESDHIQLNTKMKQLQTEFEENNISHENTTKQLQKQLQQKSEEYGRVNQEWQDQKSSIENEFGAQLLKIKQEKEAMQHTLNERESFLKDVQAQCNALQEKLNKKSEKSKELKAEIKRNTITQNTLAAELHKMRSLKYAEQNELEKQESLLKDMKEQCDELKEKLLQKTEECNKVTQELEEGKTIQSKLAEKLQEMALAEKNMQLEVNELASVLEDVQKQNDEVNQQLQQKSKELEKLKKELKEEQESKASIQNKLGKDLQAIKSEENAKLQKLMEVQKQYNELKEQFLQLSKENKKLTQEFQLEKTAIRNDHVKELQQKQETAMQELKDRENLLQDVQKQCEELKQQLQQKFKECDKITQELKEEKESKAASIQNAVYKEQQCLQQQNESLLEDLQMQCDDFQQKLQKKSEECERLNVKLQMEQKYKSLLQNELSKNEQDLKDKESCLKVFQTQCDELQKKLQKKSEDCEKLSDEVQVEQKCKASIQNGFSKQLQMLKLEEKANQREFEKVQSQCDILKQQLQQKSGECKRITQEMQALQASKSDLQKELGKKLQRLELLLVMATKEEESHVTNAQKLRDALNEEQLKNLRLEQELSQQIANRLTVEKKLEIVKETFDQREQELEKSKTNLESQNKRLERTVIKLGEQQAIVSKLQREISQTKLAHEEQAKLINALQHEKEGLQLELRTSKERTNRAEEKLSSLEQQCKKITSLEHQHERKIRLEKVRDIALDNKSLRVAEDENSRLRLEIGGLNSDIAQLHKQKADLSNQLQLANDIIAKLMREQESNKELQCNLVDKLKQALADYESLKDREALYQRKLKAIKDELELSLTDNMEMRNTHEKLLEEMQRDNRLVLEQLKSKEHQMELDCQILQAKYRDAKEEIRSFEQKLKDQRLELEGKLEKMKSKMRALYKAEVIRMKEKQERNVANTKEELEKLTTQNKKYDEHTRSLSAQIVRLNEKILEQQKQHAIVSTKLSHLQEAEKAAANSSPIEDWQPFKRPSAPSSNLGSNLAMEDEEGEVFNNTYLTDLKLGRMPDMTSEELQYRNSLQPPHLKSAYAAQYDLGSQESDLKDGPHSLDDSMSALLSTTGGNTNGARKKSMGTHYKRPGPPTPSKNGGRLSFGGSEPPREILRETYDNGCAKTPARFKLFASRFSMGSSGTTTGAHSLSRDERVGPKNKEWAIQRRGNKHLQEVGVFCTSTPRSSRLYYKQLQHQNVEIKEEIQEQKQEQQEGTPHLPSAALLMIQDRKRSLSATLNSSGGNAGISDQASIGTRKPRKSNARLAINRHGTIFAMKYSPCLSKAMKGRLQQRTKVKQHRLEFYDQARDLRKESLTPSVSKINDNNNNARYSSNTTKSPQQLQMVLDAKQDCDKNYLKEQFEENHACVCLNGASNAFNSTNQQSHDFNFDQLCLQTESTAPFDLQPLQYNDNLSNDNRQQHLDLENRLATNATASIETSTVSGNTNGSLCESWTTVSTVAFRSRSHALPEITALTFKNSVGDMEQESDVVIVPSTLLSQMNYHISLMSFVLIALVILLLSICIYFVITNWAIITNEK